MLEAQGHVAQGVDACHGIEAGIAVQGVSVLLAAAGIHGAGHRVAVGLVLLVEQVIDRRTHSDAAHVAQVERIGHVKVVDKVGIERILLALEVVQILTRHMILKLISRLCAWNRWWFTEKKFEGVLYRILAVKKWKDFLPTWNESDFDVAVNSYDELLNHICKAEVYHELCMILSFVPVLFSLAVGKFWIFFWTSVFGALVDGLFVCIQRYNRPRILSLMKKELNHAEKKYKHIEVPG